MKRTKWYMLKYLFSLYQIWKHYPYLRFGQFLNNLHLNIYYFEDKELKERLKDTYLRRF